MQHSMAIRRIEALEAQQRAMREHQIHKLEETIARDRIVAEMRTQAAVELVRAEMREKETRAAMELAEELKDGLTPYQISLLERVRRANTDPIIAEPNASKRSPAQKAASVEMHKRLNPGYVEMPYESSNTRDYKYKPPPDFTREASISWTRIETSTWI